MNLFDFYYRQIVSQGVLDWAFEQAQNADRYLSADNGLVGVVEGILITEHSPTPDLSVDISEGIAYDLDGQRCLVDTTQANLDCSVDEYGSSTAVGAAPNERWISVFVRFDRILSEPAVDGNSLAVYTKQLESSEVFVRQAAEQVIGTNLKPALLSDSILLADIQLVIGQTSILDANISSARRQDYVRVVDTGHVINEWAAGNAAEGLEDLFGMFNDHISDFLYPHGGGSISFSPTDTWYDSVAVAGSAPPVTTVEEALDAIVYDLALASATPGSARVGIDAYTAPFSQVSWSAGSIKSAVREMADTVDSFINTFQNNIDDQVLASAVKNWREMRNELTNAMSYLHYFEPLGVWVALESGVDMWASHNGRFWNTPKMAKPTGSGGYAEMGNDDTYFMISRSDGGINYTTDPETAFTERTAVAIGASGLARQPVTKYPDSNFIAMVVGAGASTVIRIGASGILGTWTGPSTPPAFNAATGDGVELIWCGGSDWVVYEVDTTSAFRVWYSDDDCDTWSIMTSPDVWGGITVQQLRKGNYNHDTGRLIIGGWLASTWFPFISYSDNYGASWTVATLNQPAIVEATWRGINRVLWVGGNVWLACGSVSDVKNHTVYMSMDDGETWEWFAIDETTVDDCQDLVCLEKGGNICMMGGGGEEVFVSNVF